MKSEVGKVWNGIVIKFVFLREVAKLLATHYDYDISFFKSLKKLEYVFYDGIV